jgi:hypothetical protein
MRKSLVAFAAAMAIAAAASITSTPAGATPLSVAGGAASAGAALDVTARVTYGCRRVWRCGPFGCGTRLVCWGNPGFVYGHVHRPWAYGAYAYRPYWKPWPHWRHRRAW